MTDVLSVLGCLALLRPNDIVLRLPRRDANEFRHDRLLNSWRSQQATERAFSRYIGIQTEQLTLGALNNGATKEEVRVVREIAIRICQEVGVKWKTSIIDL